MVDLTGVLCAGALILCAWKVFDWVWWKPKRLERYFREQGIEGPSYKLIHGNLKEDAVASMEAIAKPMKSFSHAIAPRICADSTDGADDAGARCSGGPTRRPAREQQLQQSSSLVTRAVPARAHEADRSIPDETQQQWTARPEASTDIDGAEARTTRSSGGPGGGAAVGRTMSGGTVHKAAAARTASRQRATERKLLQRYSSSDEALMARALLMLPAFRSSSEELVNNWKKLGSEGSFELDVVPAFERLTSDAISKTAFGSNYEQGKQLFEFQAEQLQIVFQSYESAYIPGARYLPTKANKRLNYLDEEIRTILRGMIKKREEAIKLGGVCNQDLLSLLVESNLRESQENTNIKNGGMSVDDIVEESKVFYFAGRETTSDLLIWTLVLLSMHQEWQERAREEVLQAFGTNKPDFDGLNRLKIVPMVLYEVLRLYPPFSMLIRHTNKATKLGEINLPQGVLVGLPVLSLHHDREIWGEDAEEFNPARFSGGVANAAKGKASFFTFGWGPRICIGQQFAAVRSKDSCDYDIATFLFRAFAYLCPFSLFTGNHPASIWPSKDHRRLTHLPPRDNSIEWNSKTFGHAQLLQRSALTKGYKDIITLVSIREWGRASKCMPSGTGVESDSGKLSIFWVGGIPRINVMEPDLVRDVLSNKFGHFTKMRPNPFTKLFATGLGSYNGEKWAKHRRIINPAFHIEKLKLDVVPEFQRLTKDVISRTAFGSNFEEGKRIFELQSEQLELVVPGLQLAYIPGSRYS
ncbi:hypothetical protein Scep_028380 [Stephania cephalantha]|uniref:Cytochrome P450 n=1 Tax=Stephania cephalantha TaxID=152367 RepID=A0AAP0EDP0_9MAGN